MVEEHGVHGFADIVVAAEREREIAHTAADVCSRKVLAYPFRGTYEVCRVCVVFLHTCGNSKHVGVEDYVERIHANLLCKNAVCSFGYLDSPFKGGGLSLLVETHHHHSCPVAHGIAGVADECVLSFLQRD